MNKYIISMVSTALLLLSANANAFMLNFLEMADGAYGESAWNQMVFTDIENSGVDLIVTAYNANGKALAYLDANEAGLGVCSTGLKDGASADVMTGSSSNICGEASDDNVSDNYAPGEYLMFSFMLGDDPFEVNGFSVTVNDNHADKSLEGHVIDMNGTPWATQAQQTDTYFFDGASVFTVAFNKGQFYVESLKVEPGGIITSVPEPTNLVLMGLAIIGLVISRKKLS